MKLQLGVKNEEEEGGKEAFKEIKQDYKNVKEIHQHIGSIETEIEILKKRTSQGLQDQKNKLWKELDANWNKYKQELQEDNLRKAKSDTDPMEREQNYHDKLEVMTKVAQDLDKENRKLKEQEQELKIEFESQKGDDDLLLKQIIYHKN